MTYTFSIEPLARETKFIMKEKFDCQQRAHAMLEMNRWCEDNLKSKRWRVECRFDVIYIFSSNGGVCKDSELPIRVYIRDKDDAVLFKLTWCN